MELKEFINYLNEKLLRRFNIHNIFSFETAHGLEYYDVIRLMYKQYKDGKLNYIYLSSWSMDKFFNGKTTFFDWCKNCLQKDSYVYLRSDFKIDKIFFNNNCIDFFNIMFNCRGCTSFEELDLRLAIQGY